MAKSDIIFTNPTPSLHKDFIKRAYGRYSWNLLRPVFEKTGWISNNSIAYGVIVSTTHLGKTVYAVYFARKNINKKRTTIVPLIEKNRLFFDKKKMNEFIREQRKI